MYTIHVYVGVYTCIKNSLQTLWIYKTIGKLQRRVQVLKEENETLFETQ